MKTVAIILSLVACCALPAGALATGVDATAPADRAQVTLPCAPSPGAALPALTFSVVVTPPPAGSTPVTSVGQLSLVISTVAAVTPDGRLTGPFSLTMPLPEIAAGAPQPRSTVLSNCELGRGNWPAATPAQTYYWQVVYSTGICVPGVTVPNMPCAATWTVPRSFTIAPTPASDLAQCTAIGQQVRDFTKRINSLQRTIDATTNRRKAKTLRSRLSHMNSQRRLLTVRLTSLSC
jgi:hypothetical protein